MTEIGPNTSKWKLQQCNYRALQQKAKSMSLPSNVKKIYLIELIYTKLHGTPRDVDAIIQRVKWERQKLTETRIKPGCRKTRVQADEISSTSIIKSPPISITPRSTKIIVRCNPLTTQNMMKYSLNLSRTKATIPKTHSTTSFTNSTINDFSTKKVECERVLRNRSKLNPPEAYRDLINIDIVKDEAEKRQQLRSLKMYSRDAEPKRYSNNHSILNISNKCVVKHRPSILTANKDKPKACRNNQSMQLVSSSVQLTPEKRTRLLSGIEPIIPKPLIKRSNYKYIHGGIGIRNRDGSYTEIKALVQKPQTAFRSSTNTNKMEIEYPLATPSTGSQSNALINYVIDTPSSNFQSQEIDDFYASYANSNKIRAEHISRQRISTVAFRRQSVINVEETLPRIHEAFSIFGNRRSDVTQPLFVQVSQESERVTNQSSYNNQPALSLYYNCDRSIEPWSHAPLLPVPTTSNTVCVNAASTVTTAKVQVPTTTVYNNQSHYSSEPSVGYSYDSYCDYLSLWEQDLNMREMGLQESNQTNSTDSSLALLASQVPAMDSSGTVSLGAMVTLPESEIEDALELISQDGDYMERIGMDEKIQCPVCAWFGPCLMLEHHIRKDHSTQIHTFMSAEWNITLTLGALMSGAQSTIVQREGRLYVLSAMYQEASVCVQLSAITSESESRHGTVTIYNKVSGEPHCWDGIIPTLTSLCSLPLYSNYLQVELSKLDLLPNSANLKLINAELVSESPGMVVCGRPELHDIHIIVFVNFS